MRKINGRQQDWQAIKKTTDKPIITIITSTFKAKEALHWTYESIKNQTYPYIQWIIVDGASTDGTVELLEQYSDVIDVWFSEPDTGIYDAWNKALAYVQGDWVQFLGAGDELYEKDTLKKASVYLKDAYPKYELVYGQVRFISEKLRKELYVSGSPWTDYIGCWEGNRPKLPVQTAIFHHSSIFSKNLRFDTSFKITSDCHLLLRVLKENNQMKYLDCIITNMTFGGISSSVKGGMEMYYETNRANYELNIKPPKTVCFKNYLRHIFTKLVTKVIGEKQYGKLIDFTKTLRGKPKVFTVE